MNYVFPLGFLSNSMSMTGLLVILVLMGRSDLAADVGIVQAVTLALFHSFSANARSLILGHATPVSAHSIMAIRLFLVLPLSGVAYWLSVKTANVESWIAAGLIFRRGMEWLSEVNVSEMEREGRAAWAWRYLLLQTISLLAVIAWIQSGRAVPVAFVAWGLAPAVLGMGLAAAALRAASPIQTGISVALLPHFGSTAIIGVVVYIFRLLILLTVGKALGGELFSAFAMGGIVGSVFANALGPSIMMHERRTGMRHSPAWINAFLYLYLFFGALIAVVAMFGDMSDGWMGKSPIFWIAVGLSMVGGVLMVHAQRIRLELIQHDAERDVFGPDVLMNIFIVALIPFIYYAGGARSLASLYLLSSVLALLFYGSALISDRRGVRDGQLERVKIFIGGLLLTPVFFQGADGIFRAGQMHFDSGGVLANLPIPVGVLACYGGILLLGTYARASVSLSIIFATFVLMVGAALTTFQGDVNQEQAKLMLLIQFVLPMIALVLGQMYEGNRRESGKSLTLGQVLFWVPASVMPLHLVASWIQGSMLLMPSLHFFSIYQHLQYVPIVLVSAFLIGYFLMGRSVRYRRSFLLMGPMVGFYVGAAASPTLLALLLFGVIIFVIGRTRDWAGADAARVFAWALIAASTYVVFALGFAEGTGIESHGYSHRQILASYGTVVQETLNAWAYYVQGIFSDFRSALFGHWAQPPRNEYPSAHNYYLDIVYNFGLISVIPLVVGILYTVVGAFRNRQTIRQDPGMLAFTVVLPVLLLLENCVAVALRQPYPGIFTFFLWGVYLSRVEGGGDPGQQELQLNEITNSIDQCAVWRGGGLSPAVWDRFA